MASYMLEGLQKLNQCLLEEFPDLLTQEQTQKACDMIFPEVTRSLESAFDKLTVSEFDVYHYNYFSKISSVVAC